MKTETPKDLNLAEWQEFLTETDRLDNPPSFMKDGKPLAMRIENTPLTTARHYRIMFISSLLFPANSTMKGNRISLGSLCAMNS